ncbi:MAG: UDP-3-O-acyl-N-acetylglucosamine deacetylase [Fimbriimonadales bacterium]
METVSTVRETLYFEGVGLHTGTRCKVALHPVEPSMREDAAPAKTGGTAAASLPTNFAPCRIVIRKGNHTFPARWDYVVDTTRATVLGDSGVTIGTVEHLMAALWMTGITHCLIEVMRGEEIPILDGSALPFVEAICPPSPTPLPDAAEGASEDLLQVRHADRYLALSLSGSMMFGYIQFPEPLGVQAGAFPIEDARSAIAPARTFGFLREVEALRAQGLALGGALKNALVIDETGYHNPARFEDEPLRHKLLDVVGDLYLSGVRLRRFTLVAVKPGHALNVQLARLVAQRFLAEE